MLYEMSKISWNRCDLRNSCTKIHMIATGLMHIPREYKGFNW